MMLRSVVRFMLGVLVFFPLSAYAKSSAGEEFVVSLVLAVILGAGVGILTALGRTTIFYFWLLWTVIGHSVLSFLLIAGLSDMWSAREHFISNLICGLIVIPILMWLAKVVVAELANPGAEQ